MKTRERILAAALSLFNENGTGAVSTNHIAQAAGTISYELLCNVKRVRLEYIG